VRRAAASAEGRVRPQRLGRDSGAVTEAERPLHERLSIFDRPQVEGDVPPDPEPSVRRWVEAADDPSAIRLGLEHAQTRIYLVLRNDDQISMLVRDPDGGSASTGPRSVFDAYGAKLSMRQVSREWLVHGVVPDHVRGVRVDGRDAVLANNTFLARVPHHPKRIVLSLTDGERTVPIPPLPRLPDID
jgi:hypothetical protein